MDSIQTRKASLRLPRAVLRCRLPVLRRLYWLLCNLFLAFGLTPSLWFREITPIRKRGPQVVSDFSNLRPISVVDELESLFDLLWLNHQKASLQQYAGQEQGGGHISSTILTLGILIALQVRCNFNLPSFILKADLLQGYDLAWKNAVLLHAYWAGVRGSYWLCLHASLTSDKSRVRLGPLVGNLIHLFQFGIGQGSRRAVHLFSALTRGLLEQVRSRAAGMALGAPPLMLQGFSVGNRRGHTSDQPRPDVLRAAVQASMSCSLAHEYSLSLPPDITYGEILHCIDVLSPHSLLLVQYIDDIFSFQSTCVGLRRVCASLTSFTNLWRHRFAGGRKRASFMVLGAPVPGQQDLAPVGDEVPEHVSALPILGALIDAELTLQPLIDQAVGRLVSESLAFITTLRDLGLGIPHQVTALPARIEASALFNIELCASASMGWPAVTKKLNTAQYLVLKHVLEAEGVSFGPGGRHRLMIALGVPYRLSTKVAIRIVCTRARILCLPPSNPVQEAILAAKAVTGMTWLDDATLVARSIGITEEFDFPRWPKARCILNQGTIDAAAKAVQAWKREVVEPTAHHFERTWFSTQQDAVAEGGAAKWDEVLAIMVTASWSKIAWKYARAWMVARLTNKVPSAVFGRPEIARATRCPLCDGALDLVHLLDNCPIVLHELGPGEMWPHILQASSDEVVLEERIRRAGRATALLCR